MADPTRCRILLVLLDGPAYPGRLAAELELTRSNVSNHLTCLRGCGLIVGTPQGRQMRYEIADRHLAHAIKDLLEVVLAVDTGEPCVDDETLPGAETLPRTETPLDDVTSLDDECLAGGAPVTANRVVADEVAAS